MVKGMVKIMRVGLCYDLQQDYGIDKEDLNYYDFSYLTEVENVRKHLELAGYTVINIGAPANLNRRLLNNQLDFDIVFNMAEGYKSRNREGLVASICESFGMPFTGTDSFGLSLSLHKFHTNAFADKLGICVPKCILFDKDIPELSDIMLLIQEKKLCFPLVVKPNHEGSSMGIVKISKAEQLDQAVNQTQETYGEEVVIEEYVDGSELSVCILGSGQDSYVFSIAQFTMNDDSNIDLFTHDIKRKMNHKIISPIISKEILHHIKKQSIMLHRGLRLRDVSRIDWRVNGHIPMLLEATPLPDFDINTEFEWGAKRQGYTLAHVLDQIIKSARKRYHI